MRRPTFVFAIIILSLPNQALSNPLAWLFKSVGSAAKIAPKLGPSAVPKIGGGVMIGKEGATLSDDSLRAATRGADDAAHDGIRLGAESGAADDAAKADETDESMTSKIAKNVGQEAIENMVPDQSEAERRGPPQVNSSPTMTTSRDEELPVLMRVPSLTLSSPTSPFARYLLKEPTQSR